MLLAISMWRPSWQRMQKLETFNEISKLGIAWQASAYGSAKGELTEEMMDVVFEIALAQHSQD